MSFVRPILQAFVRKLVNKRRLESAAYSGLLERFPLRCLE